MRLYNIVVAELGVTVNCLFAATILAQNVPATGADVADATKVLVGNWSVQFDESSLRAEAEERVKGRTGKKTLSDVEIQRQISDEIPKVEENAKRRAESWIMCLLADGTGSDIERSRDGKRKRPSHDKKVAHWKVNLENGKLTLFLEGAPEPKALLNIVNNDEFKLTYSGAMRTFVRVKQLPEWATTEPVP